MQDESQIKPKAKAAQPERMTVTFEGLVKEFGSKEGEAKYIAIALLEGEMVNKNTGETFIGRYFFDPRAEGPGYRPELGIATLPEEARKRADAIINTPQIKES